MDPFRFIGALFGLLALSILGCFIPFHQMFYPERMNVIADEGWPNWSGKFPNNHSHAD